MHRAILFFALLLYYYPVLFGQDSVVLMLNKPEKISIKGLDTDDVQYFNSKADLRRSLDELIFQFQIKGFLEANARIINEIQDTVWVDILPGKKYSWAKLKKGNIDALTLSEVRYKEIFFANKPFQIQEIKSLMEGFLVQMENKGYPFASIKLDSLEFNEGEVSASLFLDKKEFITIDTIIIIGEAKINSGFLSSYLNLRPGSVYNESIINNISQKIRNLSYLEETRNPQIYFIRNEARIHLFLKSTKSSRFDFLIGVLPNNSQTGGSLLITGDANIFLVNPFGTGKTIAASWKNLQPRSPQLDVYFNYPYLFNAPLGFDFSFNLFKRDTFYLELKSKIGLQFFLRERNFVKAYLDFYNSNLITIDTAGIKNTASLPANLDVRQRLYGVAYHIEDLDYIFNPSKGYDIELDAAAGTKVIKRNSKILSLSDDQIDFNALYDSLPNDKLILKSKLNINTYWPLGRFSLFKLSYSGGYLYNKSASQNELFRIGGQKLLRGFDDESILVSFYNIATAEFRYLISRNSYFSLFFDGAYVEQQSLEIQKISSTPFGFGIGMAFETRAGIFGLSYAVGKLNNQSKLQFKNAKIHFGYVSLF
jgi:outer membrane protein assembly factor BamA